jgi:hypothetical protein
MMRYARGNDAAMFDIDDTLIFVNGRANIPIINLLYKMKSLGYKIVLSVGDMPTDWTDSEYYINTSNSDYN